MEVEYWYFSWNVCGFCLNHNEEFPSSDKIDSDAHSKSKRWTWQTQYMLYNEQVCCSWGI